MPARINGHSLAILQSAVSRNDTAERRARYLAGEFPRADQVRDLNERYRWDLLWLAEAEARAAGSATPLRQLRDLNPNLETAHIDTALRSIVPVLKVAK